MMQTSLTRQLNSMENLIDSLWNHRFVEFNKLWRNFLPYNYSIDEKNNTATFELALAGYGADNLEVDFSNEGVLSVKTKNVSTGETTEYVHKGVAARALDFAIALNPLYQVKEATLKHGMLKIIFAKTLSKNTKVEVKSS